MVLILDPTKWGVHKRTGSASESSPCARILSARCIFGSLLIGGNGRATTDHFTPVILLTEQFQKRELVDGQQGRWGQRKEHSQRHGGTMIAGLVPQELEWHEF